MAAPKILASNRAFVTTALEYVKAEVQPQMPLGPGHFGVHARDSYTIEVKSGPIETRGVLKAAVEAYWREFGTLGRFRKGRKASAGMARAAQYAVTVGAGGERSRPITQKALAGVNKFILFYYGRGQWWKV